MPSISNSDASVSSPCSRYALNTDPTGSTPITFILVLFSFKYLPTPVIVPPVPQRTLKSQVN